MADQPSRRNQDEGAASASAPQSIAVLPFADLSAERDQDHLGDGIPGIGRAEALRRSMMALMMKHEDPRFAHPFYWAPFVIVGEGGVPADRATGVQ